MKCVRCQDELPKGTNFCVGCGTSNHEYALAQKAAFEMKVDQKIASGKRFRRLTTKLWWIWRFGMWR